MGVDGRRPRLVACVGCLDYGRGVGPGVAADDGPRRAVRHDVYRRQHRPLLPRISRFLPVGLTAMPAKNPPRGEQQHSRPENIPGRESDMTASLRLALIATASAASTLGFGSARAAPITTTSSSCLRRRISVARSKTTTTDRHSQSARSATTPGRPRRVTTASRPRCQGPREDRLRPATRQGQPAMRWPPYDSDLLLGTGRPSGPRLRPNAHFWCDRLRERTTRCHVPRQQHRALLPNLP